MNYVGEKFKFAKTLEKHIESIHKKIDKVNYFRQYLLKKPDEKYGKCLVCGEPLETNGSRFAFFYENGFRRHVHRKCSQPTKEHWILMFGEKASSEQRRFGRYRHPVPYWSWTCADWRTCGGSGNDQMV